MRVVILQPSYIPWLGFFEQMYKSDVFVFYDDVQYTKNDWRNRNRIKTSNGVLWLTVPVTVTRLLMSIREAKIADEKWKKKHLLSLSTNYAKAPFYSLIYPVLEEVINQDWVFLSDLVIALIHHINKMMHIKREVYLSSQLGIRGQRSERLLKVCQFFGADLYLSGASAINYLNVEIFARNNIKVEFQDYKHPVYSQLWGDFVPYLSVVDLLFNHGPDSLDIITHREKRSD